MKARILTALAVIPVILAVLFLLPREGVISLLGLLLLIAAWEWSGFIGVKSIAARGAYAVVVGLMMMALWSWGRSESNLTLLLWLTLAWMSPSLNRPPHLRCSLQRCSTWSSCRP